MRVIVMGVEVLQAMTAHADNAYPDECCGAMFGTAIPGGSQVLAILAIDNTTTGERGRRFSISPRDYLRAERESERLGLVLLGFYHSHPDHPAYPSPTDRAYAQSGFSYPIMTATARGVTAITSWRLPDGATWYEEESVVTADSSSTLLPGRTPAA